MASGLDRAGWKLFNGFTKVHVAAYRTTGGKVGRKFLKGAPCCLVDHVGRKSGQHRTSPLIYVRDGENVVIVASKGGHPKYPAWWINLRANPDTTVQVDGDKWDVRAREADDAERERLWPQLTEVWPPYDEYQEKTDRRIPVVILEPR
ncbi:MAG TPA: nitroreductase family deazaflavin-dependent oxidoreductase [Solirubrobacterales bacterium]|nr:nitroreductase family deazaflavin-dependent oxidoreductase [Solirubrobacterales bacterium]